MAQNGERDVQVNIAEAPRIAVVLTATISPSVEVPNLLIRDPKERLAEYLESVRWWSKLAARKNFELLVFENSGHASDLALFESERVSIVPVPIPEKDNLAKGKGAGESLMLQLSSELLRDYALILKCTGRLQVINAADLISRHLSSPTAEVVISWDSTLSKVDTRCFTVRPAFLRVWMSAIKHRVSDERGCDLESQSARWLLDQIIAGTHVVDFARSPAIVGNSASEGVAYSRHKARARMLIESFVRGRLKTDSR